MFLGHPVGSTKQRKILRKGFGNNLATVLLSHLCILSKNRFVMLKVEESENLDTNFPLIFEQKNQ